jgi:biotin carboxyl carrier protein
VDGNLAQCQPQNNRTDQPAGAGKHHTEPQVAVPMIVELDGTRCEVSAWNVAGFAPETPLPGPRLKEVRTAHVMLRIGDVEVGFDIPCQVTRETELGAAEFKFLGAFTEQAALLYRVAEDRLAGYATQFDSLLASQPVRQSRNRRKLLLGAMVSLLAISILTLGVVALTSLLTVRSRVAAVTVEGFVLRAPATGVLAGDLPPPGSSVHEGQPLFQILTADMTTKVAELSGEVNRLRVASEYSRARLREIKEVTSDLRTLSERKLDSIKSKIAALDTQISLYSKLVGNKQYLADHGFQPQSGVDMQRVDLESRREARDDAQSDLELSSTQADLLKSGVLTVDWRDTTETKATMRLLAAEAEAAIIKAEAMSTAVRHANQVTSPCDCLVYANAAKSGEVVEAGSLIDTLRPARVVPVVMALLPADQTAGLTIGNAAGVALVNGLVMGRLEKLSYDDQQTSRVGLFPLIRSTTSSTADQQMAQATISLPEDIDVSLIGTPALVAIRSNPLPRLLSGLYALQASL